MQHKDKCYRLINNELVTWDEAKQKCGEDEMELASAPDQETNSFLSDKFSSSDIAWLGGYRDDVINKTGWRWIDKRAVWGFTSWAPGEPRIYEALATNYIKPGQWDDQKKTNKHYYFCQFLAKG